MVCLTVSPHISAHCCIVHGYRINALSQYYNFLPLYVPMDTASSIASMHSNSRQGQGIEYFPSNITSAYHNVKDFIVSHAHVIRQ